MRTTVLILLTVSFFAVSVPLRLGPSVRYSIFGSGGLSEREAVSYEESRGTMLFYDSEILMFGIGMEAEVMKNHSIEFSCYLSSYGPKYVTQPDSSEYAMNRTGKIALFVLGLRRSIGDYFLSVGAETHYLRERWDDPFTGDETTRDSLAVGPSLGVGTLISLDLFTLKPEIGLVFPRFSDVIGRIGITLLIP